eukprot:559278-Hanusia_phi.AAC.3
MPHDPPSSLLPPPSCSPSPLLLLHRTHLHEGEVGLVLPGEEGGDDEEVATVEETQISCHPVRLVLSEVEGGNLRIPSEGPVRAAVERSAGAVLSYPSGHVDSPIVVPEEVKFLAVAVSYSNLSPLL